MILSLEELCYRALDLGIHKSYFQDVMVELLRKNLFWELSEIFFKKGDTTENAVGYPQRFFKFWYIYRLPKVTIKVLTCKFFVSTFLQQREVFELMESLTE